MSWPDHYRSQAALARERAESLPEGTERGMLIACAEAYERLAREADAVAEQNTRTLRKRSSDLPYLRPDIDS